VEVWERHGNDNDWFIYIQTRKNYTLFFSFYKINFDILWGGKQNGKSEKKCFNN
jgi:hypothetical protein